MRRYARSLSNNTPRGPAQFGEQPIEAAYTILALERFLEVFGEPAYRDHMRTAFNWFLGENHLHQCIYDRASGGCRDGLEEHNVSLNQGAESTVCYLIARLAMQRQTDLPRVKPEAARRNSLLPWAHFAIPSHHHDQLARPNRLRPGMQ